jgi:hypothetical protein
MQRWRAVARSRFPQVNRAPPQKPGGLLGAQGTTEVKALGLVASLSLKRAFCFGFDALGDDCDANVVGETHDRAYGELVDLDGIEGHFQNEQAIPHIEALKDLFPGAVGIGSAEHDL